MIVKFVSSLKVWRYLITQYLQVMRVSSSPTEWRTEIRVNTAGLVSCDATWRHATDCEYPCHAINYDCWRGEFSIMCFFLSVRVLFCWPYKHHEVDNVLEGGAMTNMLQVSSIPSRLCVLEPDPAWKWFHTPEQPLTSAIWIYSVPQQHFYERYRPSKVCRLEPYTMNAWEPWRWVAQPTSWSDKIPSLLAIHGIFSSIWTRLVGNCLIYTEKSCWEGIRSGEITVKGEQKTSFLRSIQFRGREEATPLGSGKEGNAGIWTEIWTPSGCHHPVSEQRIGHWSPCCRLHPGIASRNCR
jgi:hypothetical protein